MKASVVCWVMALVAVAKAAFDPTQDSTQCCHCSDLKPFNPAPGSSPQIRPSPFKVTVNSEKYQLDKEVIVELMGEDDMAFRDFILVAWPTDNRPKEALGTLKMIDDTKEFKSKTSCLNSPKGTNAVLAGDLKPKRHLRFAWETREYVGHVEFRATFIVNDDVYWVGEKSALLLDPRREAPPPPAQSAVRVTSPIDTAECGQAKGCYREPVGCWEPQCEYIVTWQGITDKVRFELGGLADGAKDRYIAVALSNDTYMGEDIVFACVNDGSQEVDATRVYLSYNVGHKNYPLDRKDLLHFRSAISGEEGSYHNGRLRCRFTIDRDIDLLYPELSRVGDANYHLLMGRGFASRGVLHRHGLGVNELPIASPKKVNFNQYDNIGDRARYPLVKAHGCLMILAWVFFASIGLLMTKYYKTMWPNQRMYEQKYWFVAHFNCMAMVFLVTVIGIILIFIEADGWSIAPDLPQRAHPILGIIIFICIIINPILALLRPSEDNKCRPVFNWFHWAFGTIANVLAIPQIFIGMDFGKANVPWWATWILVVWVIFHIVIELSLEIHQCCTYKKNKERRRKYEQQKRENPKLHIDEPEPAGRRFKRFMLFLHLTVTTIITLIMIIIIAVC